MRRPPAPLVAVAGGLLLAAATPPWGFWVLAFPGLALLDHALAEPGLVRGRRFGRAWLGWLALILPTTAWMRALTLPGYVIAGAVFAAFLAAGTVVAPRGPGRFVALPAGIVLAEWVRWRWPFGGAPLSNLAVAQVAGPLAPILRVGGALLVVAVTVTAGMALAALWRRHLAVAGGLAAAVIVLLAVAAVAPEGTPTGRTLDVAVVQGGGPQGTRAADTEPGIVLERHLAASDRLDPDADLDLVVWPEDVVDVATFTGSPEEASLEALALRNRATFVAGVIEDDGPEHFRNWAVAYGPDGPEVGRYEKVERVPFGEWVPFRSLLEEVAGAALPPRDARIGQTPAVIDTPAGRLGVAISWEVFFGERARDGVDSGGVLLLNPTNGSSYTGTILQSQQVASSRLRAIESGRWVLQVAPTGFTAIVDDEGDVVSRSAISEVRVLQQDVRLREGLTIYTRVGNAPALAVALLCLAAGLLWERRRSRRG